VRLHQAGCVRELRRGGAPKAALPPEKDLASLLDFFRARQSYLSRLTIPISRDYLAAFKTAMGWEL
jgi:hypothetical protein